MLAQVAHLRQSLYFRLVKLHNAVLQRRSTNMETKRLSYCESTARACWASPKCSDNRLSNFLPCDVLIYLCRKLLRLNLSSNFLPCDVLMETDVLTG